MDKKLMVYPFNRKVGMIVRYARLLKGYILTAAVSPKSYGYEGKDASCVEGGELTGIAVTSSFQEGLTQCDSILFSAGTFLIELDYYEEKMQEAVDCGKEVLITKELAGEFIAGQRSIPSAVKVLGNHPAGKRVSYGETKHIREISVPVMTIFQVGEYCNGFETQLLMVERFEQEGYRVSKVSSGSLGELFGIHMLPDYLYDHTMSYEDKIISFNQFLMTMVEEDQPHILLLEIEEAILPYNDRITNHFGVIPAIISKAVLADVSILNLYYHSYDKESLDHLRSFCRYALSAEIGYINLANTTMTVKELDPVNPVHYAAVEEDRVIRAIDSGYNDYDCMFFHIYDVSSVDAVYEDIVEKLSHNKETVRIW